MEGRRGGVTRQWTGKPDTHPDTRVGKSGEARTKQARLTLGDLCDVGRTRLRGRQRPGKAAQKSAEAIVPAYAEGLRRGKGRIFNCKEPVGTT